MSQIKQAGSGNIVGKLIFITLCLFFAFNFLPIPAKQINNLVYFGCLIPVLIWGVMNTSRVVAILKSESILLLFFLVIFVSALLAGNFSEAKATVYLLMLWLALVVMNLWRAQAGYWLFFVLAVFSLCAMVTASYRMVRHYIGYGDYLRVQLWVNANPNEMALLVVTAWVGLWEFYLQPKIKNFDSRLNLVGFAVLCSSVAWAIIVFQSRSALLGFSAYLGLKVLTDSRRWYLLASLLSIAGLFWLLDLHSILMIRGVSHRSEIWIDAWRHLTDVCGLVRGCGNDPYLVAGRFDHPHSAYLSMLYENGLIAFMFFLMFLVKSFFQGIKYKSRWLYVATIGFGGVLTTTGGIVHSPEPYWIYFWIPFLLISVECRWKDINCTMHKHSASGAEVIP